MVVLLLFAPTLCAHQTKAEAKSVDHDRKHPFRSTPRGVHFLSFHSSWARSSEEGVRNECEQPTLRFTTHGSYKSEKEVR